MSSYLQPIFKNIPTEIKDHRRFVNWKAEERGGKITKPPYKPSGGYAKSNDPSTWSTYRACRLASKNYDGIGFVLTSDDPYIALDFDKCYSSDFKSLDPAVEKHIKNLNSYTEISPSGRGIRVLVKGILPVAGKKKGAFEIYASGRYVTITGHVLPGYPRTIENRQSEIDQFYKEVFTENKREKTKKSSDDDQSFNLDDRLQKALESNNGAAIQQLLNGDFSNYHSQSEADLALCRHLAFWFKGDKNIIDEIFRTSKLYRKKWDEIHYGSGETYGQHIIEKAVKGCQNFYSEQSQRRTENMDLIDNIIISSKDFINIEMPERQSYLHPIISEGQIILLSGQRGVGKTFSAMSIADAITAGKNFGPWESRKSVPTLYLDGEMAVLDTRERLQLINPSDDRKSPLYLYSDAYANIHGAPRASLLNEAWRNEIKRILLNRHIKFFIIDNIASLAAGIDENKKSDWDVVNQWLIELRFAGVTTLLLHHTGKDGKDQRGTSAREDNVDLSILLKRPHDYSPENGADFIVSFSKTRVPFEALKMMKDFRFILTRDDFGNALWTWGAVRATKKQEVTKMLADGCSYDEIVETTGVTKGYISQIKKKLDKERGL